jgi:uncharacterized repeat protein (TIGR03803 family)
MNGGLASDTGLGYGVVYELNPLGEETVLYSFTGASDGGFPYARVTLGSDGNLYGTAEAGGTGGAGVVYRLVLQ